MTARRGASPFESELVTRFSDTYTTQGGEVWVSYVDALAALDLAETQGLRLLGMEGFVVGRHVYASLSRIADFSGSGTQAHAYEKARALLTGPWAEVPHDLQEDAEGTYMIDIVVS